MQCRDLVDRMALFSPNEDLEDVPSSELQYFLIDFHLANLNELRREPALREEMIKQSIDFYRRFLQRCSTYKLISPRDSKDVSFALSDSHASLSEIKKSNADIRSERIQNYKREKALETTLSRLSATSQSGNDEQIRKYNLIAIELAVYRATQEVQSLLCELRLSRSARLEVPADLQTHQDPSARVRQTDEDWRLDIATNGPLDHTGKV